MRGILEESTRERRIPSQSVSNAASINTLRPRQNGRQFPDDIFKCFFLNENVSIAIKVSLKFVPKGPINNIPALVQIMTWRRPGDKPLSEPMMVSLPTHICVSRPQWVKWHNIIVARSRKSLATLTLGSSKIKLLTISRLWRYCGPSTYRFNFLLY